MNMRVPGIAGVAAALLAAAGIAASVAGCGTSPQAGLEERVAALERELAGMRQEVRTRALLVVDDKGKKCALLDVDEEGPGLNLFDENGKTLAGLAVTKDGPLLSLADEKGEPRAGLAVVKDAAGFTLYDGKGTIRARLGVGKDGPGLVLYDEKGSAIWSGP